MKELDMIVRADKLETIKKILVDEFDCGGMTVSNVLGCGGQKGFSEEYIGVKTHVNLLPKINIKVVMKDELADSVIERLCDVIATGHCGDGKIFVKEILDAVRIRTGEHGVTAI